MVSLQAAVLALSLTSVAGGETVLLDFCADWCGPCQQMRPAVHHLAAAGYPVREVNFDQNRALAAKYGVQSLPGFVMLVDGQVVDRHTGSTSYERLEQMCRLAAARPRQQQVPIGATPQTPPPADGWQMVDVMAEQPPSTSDEHLTAATVRIRIEDATGHSWGTGTIIDARRGEALILTCGHVFRDSQGKGPIQVDMFGPAPAKGIPGKLLSYDLERDVALLSIRTPGAVTVARVAPAGYEVADGDWVVNLGCNNGDSPTVRHSRVASLNKFLGPPNLQVGGLPVQGRSGGGLFSRDGLVIGVCNAADPTDNQGLYAALESIHAQLDSARLSCVYRGKEIKPSEAPMVAVVPPLMPKQMPAPAAEQIPTQMPNQAQVNIPGQIPGALEPIQLRDVATTPPAGRQAPNLGTSLEPLSPEESAAWDEIHRRKAEGAEVICVIRPLNDPGAQSEIIVLNHVSPAFVQRLASEAKSPGQTQLTSMEGSRRVPVATVDYRPDRQKPVEKSPILVWQPRWLEPDSGQ